MRGKQQTDPSRDTTRRQHFNDECAHGVTGECEICQIAEARGPVAAMCVEALAEKGRDDDTR